MWTPWRGKDYDKSGILLLGESSYAWRERPDGPLIEPAADHPIHMVKGQLDSDQDDSRFMRMLTNALTHNDADTVAKRVAGWDRVAFTNFVPVSVGQTAADRPRTDAWALAKAEWPALLKALQPRHIVVLGLTMWDWIPTGTPEQDIRYRGPESRHPTLESFRYDDDKVATAWCHWHPRRGASAASIGSLIDLIAAER